MSNSFQLVNSIALFAWIILLLFPKSSRVQNILLYGVVGVLSLFYCIFIFPMLLDFDPSSFSSLKGVHEIFKSDQFLLAGWIHYLVFDLFVGVSIVKQGVDQGLKKWKYLLPLPFVFLFGPLGLIINYSIKMYSYATRK